MEIITTQNKQAKDQSIKILIFEFPKQWCLTFYWVKDFRHKNECKIPMKTKTGGAAASYIRMRITARPTAETEASVPMQYLITSYFAASSWARSVWISWDYKGVTDEVRVKELSIFSNYMVYSLDQVWWWGWLFLGFDCSAHREFSCIGCQILSWLTKNYQQTAVVDGWQWNYSSFCRGNCYVLG